MIKQDVPDGSDRTLDQEDAELVAQVGRSSRKRSEEDKPYDDRESAKAFNNSIDIDNADITVRDTVRETMVLGSPEVSR